MRPQRLKNYSYIILRVANTKRKLVTRGYITKGVIPVLISFFYVFKGKNYIRMVFHATVSGLNDSLWDTNFILPSMGSLLMMVVRKTHVVNLYVWEIFYNFRISSVLTNYFKVNLGSYMGHKKDREGTPLWMLWVRIIMGLVLYNYTEIQGLLWSIDVVRAGSSDPDNLFRLDNIRLNLHGDTTDPPTIPLMSKIWRGDQELAADFTTYVDDSRVAAVSVKEAWGAARRMGLI